MSYKHYEKFTNESFRVNRAYVRIAGDLVSGILLGQIVYWHLPNKDGKSKLRVFKEGQHWLAKERSAWQEEVCITPKQYDRAIKVLIDKDLVVAKKFKFNGSPTVHIRLNEVELDRLLELELTRGENGTSPKVKKEIDERVISLTESTTKTLKEDDDANADYEKQIQKMQRAGLFFMNNPTNIIKLGSVYRTLDRNLFYRLVDIAIQKKPSKIDYLDSVVNNWKQHGIDTVEKAIAESEARKKPSKPSKDEDLEKLRQMYGG